MEIFLLMIEILKINGMRQILMGNHIPKIFMIKKYNKNLKKTEELLCSSDSRCSFSAFFAVCCSHFGSVCLCGSIRNCHS